MKSKENNLEKNISRLVKLTGDSNEPSGAFADSVVKNALDELNGIKAEREESDKFVGIKWKRTLCWAAMILIVCGIGFGILISNAGKTGETTGVDFSGGPNELVVKDSGVELVVEETSLPTKFDVDEAYESLKAFNFKGLDMSISQSEPNDNMLLAAREARAKPKYMAKPKPVLQKLPQEPEHIVRVQASEALRKPGVKPDALARKKIRKEPEQAVENNKPIAHWAFEEGRGSTAYDWAGNSHGTIHGAKWTTGKVGRALSFDGVDDYVSILDATDPTAYTLTAWVNPNSASAQGIIVRTSPRGPIREWSHQLLISSSGKFEHYLYCADGTPLAVTSESPIVVDTWYHVTAVAENNGNMRLYVNGEEQGTAQRIGWLWKGGDRWYIGSNTSGLEYFKGLIDEVAIYNRALSAKEIRQLYQQGTGGLVAHWKFEEGSGTTAHDSIGNNHGTIHGAKWTTGKVGGALSFDGVDDYVDCGNDPLFDITGPITLMAWLKTSSGSSGWQGIVTKGEVLWKIQKHVGGSGDFECWGLIGAPRPGPYLSTVGVNMNDGQWHHIAGTYDGAVMRIYWDGVLNNSFSVSGTINTGSDPVYIGGVYGKPKYGFPGIIDEVAIYDRALSAEEIRQLYQQGTGGLVAHWKFEEGSGTTAHDSIGNNHGTIHGAKWITGKVGGALSFDGNGDYVEVADDDSLSPGSVVTLEAWIKPASIPTDGETGRMMVAGKWNDGSTEAEYAEYEIQIWDGKVCFYGYGADTGYKWAESSTTLVAGNWYYVAGVFDGSTLQVYINGSLDSPSTAFAPAAGIPNNKGRFTIGAQYWDYNNDGVMDQARQFHGIIDEVAIYNRALSAEEIRQLYRSAAAEPSASFVTMTAEGVMFEFRPPVGSSGWLDTELYEHGGEMLTAFSRPHSGEPVLIWLAVPVDQNDPAKYYLRYRIRITAAPSPKWQVIGLSRMPRTTNKTSDKNTPSTPVPAKDMGVKIPMSHGPVKDGLAAFLICEQNQFKLDEPVPLLYGVVYDGPAEKVPILAPPLAVDPGNLSWLSITGPDGNDVPYMGVYVMHPLPDPKDALQLRRRRFHGRLAYNIRDSFKLCTPGTYTIKWHCEMRPVDGVSCWTGELVSNEIQIEVVK